MRPLAHIIRDNIELKELRESYAKVVRVPEVPAHVVDAPQVPAVEGREASA
jgi:hypothetical protein